MKPKEILLSLFIIICSSCTEQGTIIVKNHVSNVRLESVSWADYTIAYSLLPGEESEKVKIRENKEDFPISGVVKFYMVAKGNTVYLKTQDTYDLGIDETVTIIITDSTDVINPMIN